MDPITIATTVGGLIGTCVKVTKYASSLLSSYKDAPLAISTIASETYVLSAALSQVENVAIHSPASLESRLKGQKNFTTAFDMALSGCSLVLSVLEKDLLALTGGKEPGSVVGKLERVRVMWNQERLKELLGQVRGQQIGLNLLISALQTESLAEIKDLLHKNSGVLNSVVRRTGTLRLSKPPTSPGASPTSSQNANNLVSSMSALSVGGGTGAPYGGGPVQGSILDSTGPIRETTAFLAASMISAIEQDNIDLIDRLLLRGYDVNYLAPGNRAPLIVAVQKGNDELVVKFMECGANAEMRDNESKTALNWAGEKGFTTIARSLIEKGAKIDAPGRENMDTLNQAAFSGQFELVELLLGFGANIETTDDDVMNPLHNASQFGHYKTMDVLLKMGARVNVRDKFKRTALIWAVHSQNAAAVELLIQWGADTEARDDKGHLPVHWAAARDNVDVLSILLRTGKHVKAPTDDEIKDQPLHFAAIDGKAGNINLLLDKGADIDALDAKDRTALFQAVDFGHLDAVKALLKRKASTTPKNTQGFTALTAAAIAGKTEITKELLDHGADIKETYEQHSVLVLAVRSGKADMVAFLLDRGVDINHRSGPEYSTALQEAILSQDAVQHGRLDIIHLLIRKGAKVKVADINLATPLHRAAFSGNIEILRAILSKCDKSIVNAVTDAGFTALHIAAMQKQVGAAKLLLQHKAKISAKDKEGCQPIHLAAVANCAELIHLFIKEGASVKAKDLAENTPLHPASGAETVDALLQYKAPKEQWNKWGQTPLDCYAQLGYDESASVLLRRGAKVDSLNKDKETPLHRAIAYNKPKVVKLLIEWEASLALTVTKRALNSLHVAVETKDIDIDIVTRILDKAPQLLDVPDKDGKTPLYMAAEMKASAVALLLLTRGANTECQVKSGMTPFLVAISEELWDVVDALLARGCNVFAMAKEENVTALHYIAITTRVDIAELLLSRCVDPRHKNSYGLTAYDYAAARSPNPRMAEVLLRAMQ